ncbi:MAG: sarcosine oxidase subunit gamma family protein [Pseudomonadota bacterium]|uniref:sarcosine oxidase subunit gamma n=1 Tax=unclassified Phenylobacterium TaxID=2640670 RepID=UPI0006FA16D4|nr:MULTISPECIES: sarcosine oxidase subunit gamma family protein [unclassified Phenylobacterium]KRB48829.1 hypothetical protein ASE02_00570 [Phenylobacterium sp. Root700]MBT9470585.1 sarcosine oxidase subunit gamma [Phenylobacterium sp.]
MHDTLTAQRPSAASMSAPAIVKPLPAASRFILQGSAAVMAAAAAALALPDTKLACRASAHGERAILWLGPYERLVIGGEAEGAELTRLLAAALVDLPHSLVEVTDRQIAFEVTGPHAAELLNSACPLDLDLSQFPVGMCTRTILAKAEIVLWRTAPETFRLEVWRSFSAYVVGLLEEAGRA